MSRSEGLIWRKALDPLADSRGSASHPGLILDRYATRPVAGDDSTGALKSEERRALLRAAIRAGRDPGTIALYRLAHERWAREVEAEAEAGRARHKALRTLGRLAVGLGAGNVIETGIRLHRTYGVPTIPGSALKGLAAHYAHDVRGRAERDDPPSPDDLRFRRDGDYHRLLFGSQDDGGCVAFHDAWIDPDSLAAGALALDVITPHHPDFPDSPEDHPPTDFDSPIPIAFLSTTGTFRVAVSWSGPSGARSAGRWAGLALEILEAALRDWGVGGKTRAGYGRLGPLDAPGPREGDRARPEEGPAPGAGAPSTPGPRIKRDRGTPARVTIVGVRPKGGFDVEEDGRKGALTQGTVRGAPGVGDSVDVFVLDDGPANRQFTWDAPRPKPDPPGRGPRRPNPR